MKINTRNKDKKIIKAAKVRLPLQGSQLRWQLRSLVCISLHRCIVFQRPAPYIQTAGKAKRIDREAAGTKSGEKKEKPPQIFILDKYKLTDVYSNTRLSLITTAVVADRAVYTLTKEICKHKVKVELTCQFWYQESKAIQLYLPSNFAEGNPGILTPIELRQ